jgi:hypothetical protein
MPNIQSIVESVAQDLKKPTSYPVEKLSHATPVAKYLPALLITRAAIRENKSKPVVFSPPIIEHQDRALIYRRTINVIQGQNGSHKSGLVGILVSTLISSLKIDLAGFSSKKDIQTVVCIADTERNISEQLPFAIQNMQVKAGFHISEHPTNLDYISLLDVSRSERFQALQEYIEFCTTEHQGKHLLIVLDVLTDCCEDFNRTDSSMQLIDHLNRCINRYDVTFLCVIHENPGSAKARGHLGTELINKASTVLSVGFEQDSQGANTDLIRVKFLKSRTTKRYEPFHLRYCDDYKGLVLADMAEVKRVVEARQTKALISDIAERIESYLLDGPMQSGPLVALLRKDFDASKRTIETRIKEVIDSGVGFHNKTGQSCTLERSTQGAKVLFTLKVSEP